MNSSVFCAVNGFYHRPLKHDVVSLETASLSNRACLLFDVVKMVVLMVLSYLSALLLH